MVHFYQKWWKTARDIALLLLTIYLFTKLFWYLFGIAKPLFFGYVLFFFIEPLARFLHKKGMKKILATSFSTLLFVVVIGGLLTTIGIVCASQIQHLSHSIPKYAQSIQKQAYSNTDYIKGKIDSLPDNVGEKIHEYTNKGIAMASDSAKKVLVDILGGFNKGFTTVTEGVIGLVIAFLISAGSEQIKIKYEKHAPKTFKHAYIFLKENVGRGIAGYIKAQLILMLFTFIFLAVALMILRVENGITVALLSSVFSIVPVIGTATVIAPWIIYLLIVGHTALAIKLLILQLILVALRHVIEPKLMADTLGVSALKMFSFMIVCSSLFGIAGLFLTPIFIIVYESLAKQGYFKKWIYLPQDEF
jgi:sporulation integral membrane protein YtvI